MPRRKVPLVTGYIYHVFNRSVNGVPIFGNKKVCRRFIESLNYYKNSSNNLRLSYYLRLSDTEKQKRVGGNKLAECVSIIAYCLMSNHFHLLVRQENDNGISEFMSKVQNSCTRYINTLNRNNGHVFKSEFKSVLIESNEQLIHVSRYIHLNPYSSYLVKNLEALQRYEWSSLKEFLGAKSGICRMESVISCFKNKNEYKAFVFNQADYQRNLQQIKHLILE